MPGEKTGLTNIELIDSVNAAVLYGPCLQGTELNDGYKIAALRASGLKNCTSPYLTCDTSDHFSPILRYVTGWSTCTGFSPGNGDDYETIIGNFDIADFEPHCPDNESECDGCDDALACPGL